MDQLLRALVAGTTNASIYALIAFSLILVFRGSGVLNFGAGYVATIGGLVFADLFGLRGGWAGVILAALAGAAIGAIVYLLLVRFAMRRKAGHIEIALMTLGVGLVLYYLAGVFWPKRSITAEPLIAGSQQLGNVVISNQRILMVVASIVILGVLILLIEKSPLGWALQAVAFDRTAAGHYGINVTALLLGTWALGGALAATAGALITPTTSISRDLGLPLVLIGLAAAVVGGMGSLYGPLIGAVIVGLSEALFVVYVSSAFAGMFSFLLLLIVLIVRPQGILSGRTVVLRT
ncbi:branched-chain amino acid ABC transporter permease [Salinibacterium sp. ZJ454]|uniref:branched-chain amino acid ABC transporter permease n=1 Tax=Salinibacterium sp. ZJ454 TaxID=2708339 RepID=UPI001422F82E|nr:branched-chain amino acid ABC transporter permease [Salinibacterium sp. ZJ454]